MNTGTMIYWRWKAKGGIWLFGFVAGSVGGGLIRLGAYNGDYQGGSVVAPSEIEWRPYR